MIIDLLISVNAISWETDRSRLYHDHPVHTSTHVIGILMFVEILDYPVLCILYNIAEDNLKWWLPNVDILSGISAILVQNLIALSHTMGCR